jgi:hypothetical protein
MSAAFFLTGLTGFIGFLSLVAGRDSRRRFNGASPTQNPKQSSRILLILSKNANPVD